jgi:hypothetical protein
MYTCDPGVKPTLDSIEQPKRDGNAVAAQARGDRDSNSGAVPASAMVTSRCIAVSQRIYARARVPAATVPKATWSPLQRELRIYLSASAAGTGPEREALHTVLIPQVRHGARYWHPSDVFETHPA